MELNKHIILSQKTNVVTPANNICPNISIRKGKDGRFSHSGLPNGSLGQFGFNNPYYNLASSALDTFVVPVDPTYYNQCMTNYNGVIPQFTLYNLGGFNSYSLATMGIYIPNLGTKYIKYTNYALSSIPGYGINNYTSVYFTHTDTITNIYISTRLGYSTTARVYIYLQNKCNKTITLKYDFLSCQ